MAEEFFQKYGSLKKEDNVEALVYLQKAADLWHDEAVKQVISLYYYGVVPGAFGKPSIKAAAREFKNKKNVIAYGLEAEKHGINVAWNLMIAYENIENYEQALHWAKISDSRSGKTEAVQRQEENEKERENLYRASEAYTAGNPALALFWYTVCKESTLYTKGGEFRRSVDDAIERLLAREENSADYIMPRPVGSILPEELCRTAKEIKDSTVIPANRKKEYILDYLSGIAEMGYGKAVCILVQNNYCTKEVALKYCEKAIAVQVGRDENDDSLFGRLLKNYETLESKDKNFLAENWNSMLYNQKSRYCQLLGISLIKKSFATEDPDERNQMLRVGAETLNMADSERDYFNKIDTMK